MKHSRKKASPHFRSFIRILLASTLALTLLCSCTPQEKPPHTEPSESTQGGTQSVTEPVTTELVEPTPDSESFTWANPLSYQNNSGVDHVRDPFILKVDNAWYMTGTLPPYGMEETQADRTKGVPLYRSTDLLHWEFIDYIVKTPDQSENKWYSERFWAPELFAHNGKYYVTVNCCALDGSNHGFLFAVADSIEGPYTIMNPNAPLALGNDAHLFADDDGQIYLFASGIWMAKFDLENLHFLSSAKQIISPIPNSDKWNAERPGVGFEGPYVLKHEGRYYCFYSTWARGYEIGVAVADDINGPWTMYENPMYGAMSQERCDFYGSRYQDGYYLHQDKYRECGHNSIFQGPDGGLWIAAHVTGGGVVQGVQMTIDKVIFDEAYGLIAIDPATNAPILGPTHGEQTVKYDAEDSAPQALKALDVWGYTSVGNTYALPSFVDVLMDNGFRTSAQAMWEGEVDTSVSGKAVINGTATLGSQTYPIRAFIEVTPTVYSSTCDFEDLEAGTTELGGTFGNTWSVLFSLYSEIGRPAATVTDQDGNRFLRNTAYFVAGLKHGALADNYTLSLDWRLLSSETVGGPSERLGGIAVRSADRKLAHHDEDTNLLVGGSGIMLYPTENGVRIAIKQYLPEGDGYKVASQSVFFDDLALGNEFNTFTIEDNGDRINIFVNNLLLCYAELGDQGSYPASDYTYMRTVKLMDANGALLLNVTDALVTTDREIHLIARGWTCFDVDNIRITKN
ncbi:MAG: hypothetical protein E7594_04450 [Ruminococcaceae bacterium]|nr:hypothetical protein [Oscillospiraceae bacterium]